ncbi:MAG: BREX-1 system adenine-specific DNA-methyltransferase PglX [Deltaproteobacteria bacterium]|nr:BREX-1 system adenine-specific DNA-methyltransferase PglX [Deltaproteobacteria bacterium]
MDTSKLKKFAQNTRRKLMTQVGTQLDRVLNTDSAELREYTKAIEELKTLIRHTSKEHVIEKVAYIWFNRFCALRFMDVNNYTFIKIVSPAEGFVQPEILAEAKQDHVDELLAPYLKQGRVTDILQGKITSRDPQGEVYRLLLVATCNYYNTVMPFMFERIADYTELLMPEDLLSENSVLASVREVLTSDVCKDVEVIGWLYQFYISEKKDEVFAGLKKGKKISPDNIPAATQLFTPNWIVRYLVENSLGRLWMLNHPESKLATKMEYYIKPVEDETDFLKISKPEEIKICDPACGSGHMLVYAFEVLYSIYEELGYNTTDIPSLILKNNLYGIEIDERAGSLAAFALSMKAREKYRRFLNKPVQPNICVLQNIKFTDEELDNYMDEVGRDLFTAGLTSTLKQFEEADNFGSLIQPEITNVTDVLEILKEKQMGDRLFLFEMHQRVLRALRQADYLGSKYHVVVANPPYMGGKGMNARLADYAKGKFPDSKSDLFSVFVERFINIICEGGYIGLMTPFTWMFLSSYEKLRNKILNKTTLTSLVRPEYHAFFDSAYVPLCSFVLFNKSNPNYKGSFIDLNEFYGADLQAPKTLEAIRNPECGWFHRASASDFKKIPGIPIAYWASPKLLESFQEGKGLRYFFPTKQGMATSDNTRFLRDWAEVSLNKISFNCNTLEESENLPQKWYPYNKGGDYRKWYGNNEQLVNWHKNGKELKEFQSTLNQGWTVRLKSREYYFKPSITWTFISSANFGVRYSPPGYIFDVAGSSAFPEQKYLKLFTSLLCSKITQEILRLLNPTMNYQVENISAIPFVEKKLDETLSKLENLPDKILSISKSDWDAYEASWDFTILPLLNKEYICKSLNNTYKNLRKNWIKMTYEMKELEEKNNTIFIEIYDMQDELTPEVPLKEITLTCNPHYRYGGKKTDEELETLLLADTMKEFISYSIGCMFGRYSLDKPGLILANQGEAINDYLAQIPTPTYMPDDDNVIPIMDVDWFNDDIAERFKQFLKTTFGEEHYDENLKFIEDALGKDIRKYFLKDFYNHHIKMYKKRPIYWMFSSPSGSFNALIYMHRYRKDTVSVVLNGYLREFTTKLNARKANLEQTSISASASQSEKTKALKEIEKIKKMLKELEGYEKDILYPLATQQIEIDLDDGVKVNYLKFGAALKKIAGLEDKDE